MSIFESDIEEEDLIRGLPTFIGGFAIQSPPAPQIVRYVIEDNVSGFDFAIDDVEIDLSTLEDLDEAIIRRRLWIFRNGYKLIYNKGFTIDFTDNKIELEYEAEDEVFELYLYPT
jgi:hypothetical protein